MQNKVLQQKLEKGDKDKNPVLMATAQSTPQPPAPPVMIVPNLYGVQGVPGQAPDTQPVIQYVMGGVQGNQNRGQGRGRGNGNGSRVCYYCQKPGHVIRECRKKAREQGTGQHGPMQGMQGYQTGFQQSQGGWGNMPQQQGPYTQQGQGGGGPPPRLNPAPPQQPQGFYTATGTWVPQQGAQNPYYQQ